MHSTTDSPWLSTAALAAELDVPEGTVRAWRHTGRGPRGVRLGRGVKYRRTDVDAWIAALEAEEAAARPSLGPTADRGALANPSHTS